jgi:ADP-heptose:LPS heptosyltransferase
MSSLFYTDSYLNLKEYFEPSVFHLEHMALLAKVIGAADVHYAVQPPVVPAAAHAKVASLLDGAFAQPAPLVAVAPATQWPSKHWPEEHWVKLIYQLLSETNLNLALVGSPGDASVVARVLSAFPSQRLEGRVVNLAGKTSIQEMYAFYHKVQAAVGSDSAPLHIAGAVAVPVLIGIYGPTGYRRTPPIGSAHIKLFSTEGQLSCQPCHKRVCPLGTTECMSRVTPATIFDALLQTLAEAGIHDAKSSALQVTGCTN